MFEKFGELNSFGEINELAENLFNEGDTESLRAKQQRDSRGCGNIRNNSAQTPH